MEKIREALAKAKSDKAFREGHPVNDLGSRNSGHVEESNDTDALAGAVSVADIDHDRLEPESEPRQEEHPEKPAVGGPLLQHSDDYKDEPAGDLEIKDELELVATTNVGDSSGPQEPDSHLRDNDDPPPSPAKRAPKPKPRIARRITWAMLLIAIAGLGVVHYFFLSLDEVWLIISAPEGVVAETARWAFQSALSWAENIWDLIKQLAQEI